MALGKRKKITVAELDPIARRIGAYRNHWARQTYARCLAADDWPPYTLLPT